MPEQSYRERLPQPAGAGTLACVWLQHVPATAAPHEHRAVPNACGEISYRLGDATAWAHGLLDADIELDCLWGRPGQVRAAQMAAAASADEAAALLEAEVVRRSMAAAPDDGVLAGAVDGLQPWRRARAGELSAELFVSQRQLRRRMVAAFGHGPRTLQRILRFQGFLALSSLRGHRGRLSEVAAAAGYADQAHLSRECLRLTGLTPGRFLEETRAGCGPSHDHRASFAGVQRALLTPRRDAAASSRRPR